jgi:hypothetical protein
LRSSDLAKKLYKDQEIKSKGHRGILGDGVNVQPDGNVFLQQTTQRNQKSV